jgi:hypothetical protein
MSFLVSLALLIVFVGIVPVVAHLLRRGRAPTVDFPAARWIQAEEHTAKNRSKLYDRALLLVRAGIIVTLALLGAVPLIRCDRKTLERTSDASVARIIVLDDSGSMHTEFSKGKSRFDVAKETALALVEQLREGDSMAIVLASKPAQIRLAPSLSASTVLSDLASLSCSDKETDIGRALQLAHSLLEQLPHTDKRVLLLSDLGERGLVRAPDVTLVIPELAKPSKDCALGDARQDHDEIKVNIACNEGNPSSELFVELVDLRSAKKPKARTSFVPSTQTSITFATPADFAESSPFLSVRLATSDSNRANDSTPVIPMAYGRSIGYFADSATSRPTTGGPPMIEQALRALLPNATIVPFSTVPDDDRSLAALSALILDDPPNLSAEARSAITEFVNRGSTAIALFGPSASVAQLASLHSPFLEQQAKWEVSDNEGLELKSLDASVPQTIGLDHLAAKGRFVFDESQDPKAIVRARWKDQVPFWLERPKGRGLLFVFGLPTQVALSDWALRPGFLTVLDHILENDTRRGLSRVVTVGQKWQFPRKGSVRVLGPTGPLAPLADTLADELGEQSFVPNRVGRYRVEQDNHTEERIALYPTDETLTPPQPWPVTAGTKPNQVTGQLDISRHLVVGLLALMAIELLLRLPRIAPIAQKLATKLAPFRRLSPKP